jgi:peptide/nickel transport system substrate-binding protein
MKRRTFLKGATGVGLVTAGGLGVAPGRPSSAASDVITVGVNNDIVTWDPLSVSEWYTTAILPSVLETAVTNKDGAYIPWVLESIQPKEATVWRMRLRPGIKFHDEEPLDARALKWNLDLYADRSANYPNPGSRVLVPLVKEVIVVDDRTVDLVTTQASALVFEGLTRVYLLPPTYFQRVGRQAFGQTPVGTGAWRFKQWQRGSSMTLVRNDNYWGEKPNFGTIVFRTIPESVSRVSALVAGEIDMAAGVDPQQAPVIRNRAGLRVETGPGTMVFIGLDTLSKPFSDVRVRRAVNFAVNWDEIINRILLGAAERNVGLFYPFQEGADATLRTYYKYDPPQAKQLLAEAGLAQGFSVPFYYAPGLEGVAKNDVVAQAIAADLAAVGIKVNLEQVDPGTFFTLFGQRKFADGMFQYSFTTVTPAGRHIYALLNSRARSTYHKDLEMDKAIDAYIGAVTPAERVRAGKALHRYIVEQAPLLFGYQQKNLFGAADRLLWTPWLESPFHAESMRIRG